jgi:hypothetical protein
MSLSTGSSTLSPYTATNSGGGYVRAIEDIPAKIVAGVEGVGEAVGDVASATVSLSARALQAFEDGGKAVLEGAEDVIAFPFEMAADAVEGVANVIEGGYHMLSNGVQAVVSGAASAAHAVAIDLPAAVASDVADVTRTAMNDAASLAGAAATVAGGVKMIGALL